MSILLLILLCNCSAFRVKDKNLLEKVSYYYGYLGANSITAKWSEVYEHPEFFQQPILVIEVIQFNSHSFAKSKFLTKNKLCNQEIERNRGKIRKVMDIVLTGVGDKKMEKFENGMTLVTEYPSRYGYFRTLLHPTCLESHQSVKALIAHKLLFIARDARPAFTYWFNVERDASQFNLGNVDGHSKTVLLDKLLKHFPNRHSDPQRKVLKKMLNRAGFRSEPIYLMNMYDFGDKTDKISQEKGQDMHFKYYQHNILHALSRGIKTQFIAKVEHIVLGSIDWDVIALNYWPSLANFTDFRLVPDYYQFTHKYRLNSSRNFGNFTHTLHDSSLD